MTAALAWYLGPDLNQQLRPAAALQSSGKSQSTLSSSPQSSGDTLVQRSSPDPVKDMSFLLTTLTAEGDTSQATTETPSMTAESFSQAVRRPFQDQSPLERETMEAIESMSANLHHGSGRGKSKIPCKTVLDLIPCH